MMSLSRLRDSRDFSPYSSSTEWADEDEGEAGGSKSSNTLSSAQSEAHVEGPAVAWLACLTGLKKEDMEEGTAVELSAADVEGPAVAGSADYSSFAYLFNSSSVCRTFQGYYGCVTMLRDNNIHKKNAVKISLMFSGKHRKTLNDVVTAGRGDATSDQKFLPF
ncbi:hypothetical protein E2C01_028267 [Portunus trituberculatus]|uniref:Uncharacterized protein n=1 Tax=Portunus trituberculatus TaxID=210409 RepID=A0A5B7EPJ8_PORTR|nr:hypothetical protein [Portunus trituberculatus]